MTNADMLIIGSEAPKFIVHLIDSLPEIDAIAVFRPPLSSPIQQDKLLSAQERDLIAQTLSLREKTTLPFWDALFLKLSSTATSTPRLLQRALAHNPQTIDFTPLSRAECIEEKFRNLINARPRGGILALSSKVSVRHRASMHIPMLDFHCKASRENQALAIAVIVELGLKGYLAESGQSYHFYGDNLVDENVLVSMLAKALLFAPVVDRAWIAHQLIERACGLRISPGKDYRNCPRIVCRV